MLPLHSLLDRIKWDPVFGAGTFAVGFVDHVTHAEKVVPLAALTEDPDRPETLVWLDDDGIVHHIPMHRVRTVYKDGNVIWHRPEPRSARKEPPREGQ
jgi:uncharacterized protein (UPF0248 family)